MATPDAVYVCEQCGHVSATWGGKCENCGEWDTLTERDPEDLAEGEDPSAEPSSSARRLSEIEKHHKKRRKIGVDELDQLFGGGVVQGAVTLIGGEPGIGKSTLLLQICHTLASSDAPALYVSAEESASQTAMRAKRLNVDPARVELLCESRVGRIRTVLEEKRPPVVVIDSIQRIRKQNVDSSTGSVVQIRECTNELVTLTKSRDIPLFVVGHVTKEGNIAGPKTMEHMVDTVLYFEGDGDQKTRMLRSVKNRFGSTNSVALLKMTGEGLKQVNNPSSYFLQQHEDDVPGWVSVPTRVGNRTLTLELQALTSFAAYGNPARRCTGLDFDRMMMVLAVLKKHAGLSLGEQDVHVNVAGGVSTSEPAADLPIALAIASSFRDRPVSPGTAAVGEVGLAGEIRDVEHLSSRISEIARLGFDRFLVPDQKRPDESKTEDLTLVSVSDVSEALDLM